MYSTDTPVASMRRRICLLRRRGQQVDDAARRSWMGAQADRGEAGARGELDIVQRRGVELAQMRDRQRHGVGVGHGSTLSKLRVAQ